MNYTYNAIFNTFLPISKKEGKAIDQMKIIDYSNDTLYIFQESLEKEDFRSRYYIKSNTGLFELYSSANGEFRGIEKIHCIESQKARKYYDSVFEWGDLLTFLRKNWSTKNMAYAELTRIIIKDYKIKYIDKWYFENIDMPIITKLPNHCTASICTTPVHVGNTLLSHGSLPSTRWPRSTTTSRPTPIVPATR